MKLGQPSQDWRKQLPKLKVGQRFMYLYRNSMYPVVITELQFGSQDAKKVTDAVFRHETIDRIQGFYSFEHSSLYPIASSVACKECRGLGIKYKNGEEVKKCKLCWGFG